MGKYIILILVKNRTPNTPLLKSLMEPVKQSNQMTYSYEMVGTQIQDDMVDDMIDNSMPMPSTQPQAQESSNENLPSVTSQPAGGDDKVAPSGDGAGYFPAHFQLDQLIIKDNSDDCCPIMPKFYVHDTKLENYPGPRKLMTMKVPCWAWCYNKPIYDIVDHENNDKVFAQLDGRKTKCGECCSCKCGVWRLRETNSYSQLARVYNRCQCCNKGVNVDLNDDKSQLTIL